MRIQHQWACAFTKLSLCYPNRVAVLWWLVTTNLYPSSGAHNPEQVIPLCPCNGPPSYVRNSSFLDRFSRDFWLSNKPYKSFRKNRRLGDSFFWCLTAFTCWYCYYHYYRTMVAHTNGAVLPFSWEKILQNDAKNKVICENAFAP